MLTRKQILKGRGFANRDPEVLRALRQAEKSRNIDVLLAGKGRMANMAGSTSGVPISKEQASQSQAYQVATRSIGYCMRCGCSLGKGHRQFCHADESKGIGIKTDVRAGWLGCNGCHYHVGTSGRMRRDLRRATEKFLAWKTRTTLRKLGLWPARLPDTWAEKDEQPVINPEARQ